MSDWNSPEGFKTALTALTAAGATLAKLRAKLKTRRQKDADDAEQLREIVAGLIGLMTTSSESHRELIEAQNGLFEKETHAIVLNQQNIAALKKVAEATAKVVGKITHQLNQVKTLILAHERRLKALEAALKKRSRTPRAPKAKRKRAPSRIV